MHLEPDYKGGFRVPTVRWTINEYDFFDELKDLLSVYTDAEECLLSEERSALDVLTEHMERYLEAQEERKKVSQKLNALKRKIDAGQRDCYDEDDEITKVGQDMTKQFLMLCDETGMEALKNVFRESSVQFLEVQGLSLNNENRLNILVTPVISPVNPAHAPIPTVSEQQAEK